MRFIHKNIKKNKQKTIKRYVCLQKCKFRNLGGEGF